jgi:transcriptional regulator with XRE-family HTH domain
MTEKELRVLLGANLKKYRSIRKFTQADFAEKIDISIPFLSDIENGKKWVSPNTLIKMADILDVEAYELLKPDSIPPDNAVNIIEKYSNDLYRAFGNTLEELSAGYISRLKNKP